MKKQYHDLYRKNMKDSMFYPRLNMPIATYEYKGRKWGMFTFGEVRINYMGERYYSLYDICSSDDEYTKLDGLNDYEKFEVLNNNWYELRPLDSNAYYEYGLYDDIYFDVDEVDEGLLDWLMNLEKEYDQQNRKVTNDS